MTLFLFGFLIPNGYRIQRIKTHWYHGRVMNAFLVWEIDPTKDDRRDDFQLGTYQWFIPALHKTWRHFYFVKKQDKKIKKLVYKK